MLRLVVAAALCLTLLSGCGKIRHASSTRAAKRAQEQAARAAALEWLELLDDQNYEEAYDHESPRIRAGGTARQFVRSMNSRRAPFGRAVSRKFIGAAFSPKLTGAPDGRYESILFRTSFQHKAVAAERVILSWEASSWRVVDYRLY